MTQLTKNLQLINSIIRLIIFRKGYMKTNLKVLMFGLLVGCASFSANSYYGETYVNSAATKFKDGCKFMITKQNWSDYKYFMIPGTVATVGVTAAVAYLICKKIKCNRAKAQLTNDAN